VAAVPKILIAGCSAIGSVFAYLLRRAGHDVTLLGGAWQNPTRSLKVSGLWGSGHADGFCYANTIDDLDGDYDLIIFSDAATAVDSFRPFATTANLALALSNDLRIIDAIASVFGAEQTLGACASFGAKIIAPGQVVVDSNGPIAIGPLEVSDCVMMEQIHGWIRAFQAAHLPCVATTEILTLLNGNTGAACDK
jgi:ketopantoate reductase